MTTSVALAAIALLAYSLSLTTGFNADDFFILARVKAQNGLAAPSEYFRMGFFEFFRPVAFISHALDWQIWGLNAFGFHLTNVLLHASNTVLVYLVGRRLMAARGAAIAALLFAVHPASHEAVYWMAARFDLLATCFTLLALLLVSSTAGVTRVSGYIAFALALLSKESAVSLLVIAPAWDVWTANRDWKSTARRLVPLIVVAAGYAALRAFATDLEPTGGTRRLAKLGMIAVATAAVLIAAGFRERIRAGSEIPRSPRHLLLVPLVLVTLVSLLLWETTSSWVGEKLGFVSYAAFYLLSPVVIPSPSSEWFSPVTTLHTLPGLFVAALIIAAALRWSRAWFSNSRMAFLIVFAGAALLPVSSMVGGLRYLYLATAAIALLGGWLIDRIPSLRQRVATAAVFVLVVVSASQVLLAGRLWRANATVTQQGIELMAASILKCGETDITLLTAPVGQGDVYGNFYWDAFGVLTGCSPRTFTPILRVVRTDAEVRPSRTSAGTIELRVPHYAGNIVASPDLRNFGARVAAGSTATFETAAGEIQTFPEGTTQVFRITLSEQTQRSEFFYYSSGTVRKLERIP